MSSPTSRRIGGPKRRRSSSASSAWMRFSVSSSSTVDILVAGEPESVVIEDLHAGEQIAQVVGDEILEREEPRRLAVVGELDEPGQHGRHLEPRELLPARAGVADADRQVEREARDVGKRVGRVDGERHEHREDLGVEVVVELGAVGVVDVVPRDEFDADLGEGRPHQ